MAADEKQLALALKLRNEGAKMKEILEATELNYSQVWLYLRDKALPAKLRVSDKDRTATKVRQLRDDEQCSWGEISVRFGYHEFPESKIRRMYREASGYESKGLRIGRGGRFLDRDPVLYAGDRKEPGIAIEAGASRAEIRELSERLANEMRAGGGPRKATGATKKRVSGAVKKAAVAKPVKKATKATKKTAKKVG